MSRATKPRKWPDQRRRAQLVLRLTFFVGFPAAVFCAAFLAQGLKGWDNVLAAALVELTPGLILGRLAWAVAPKLSRGPAVMRVLRHLVAGCAFAVTWTVVIGIVVNLMQPAARANFFGVAVWHALAAAIVYGMIVAASVASALAERLQEQATLASQAELAALRARLNPHFLFNTLHTINALVRSDPTSAQKAIEGFGALMHYILESDNLVLVTLEDELDFVRGYLAIEKLRLGSRLRIVEAIEDDALDCSVPPLLLQPLVENAVRHGIDQCQGGGTVEVRATIAGERLVLEVEDDGAGCARMNNGQTSRVGISTTRRRLEALFGNDAKIDIATAHGHGFRIALDLPAFLPR